jgi:Na+/H+-dicarboxylate symporter
VGWLSPEFATNDWIKALGDGFIRLIKMIIAPIIFCTVVSGISHNQRCAKGRSQRSHCIQHAPGGHRRSRRSMAKN